MSAPEWLPPRESYATAGLAVLLTVLALVMRGPHPGPGGYVAFGVGIGWAGVYAVISVLAWIEHWRFRGVPWVTVTLVEDDDGEGPPE